jgi:ABC-type tungstate transport system permease subunit
MVAVFMEDAMRKLIAGAVTALMLVPAAAYSDQPAQSVTLASDNSGLLAAILPGFTRATGISVRVLALSTNQALDAARRGDADLVLVHDPVAEQKFLDDGSGINPRQIARNAENDPHLINRYDVIELNPAKYRDAKLADAKTLADWLVSPVGQAAIGGYHDNGRQLFTPSAEPPERMPANQRYD